jgi:hypothetical protein
MGVSVINLPEENIPEPDNSTEQSKMHKQTLSNHIEYNPTAYQNKL